MTRSSSKNGAAPFGWAQGILRDAPSGLLGASGFPGCGVRPDGARSAVGKAAGHSRWAPKRGFWLPALAVLPALLLCVSPSLACTGDGCLNVWSTAPGGGELRVRYDLSQPVRVFEALCNPERTACLFSAIDPGFRSPEDGAPEGLFPIVDGTRLSVEIVDADSRVAMNVNGVRIARPGETAALGTTPGLHVHPSWQVTAPASVVGTELPVSFRVRAASGYTESATLTARVVAVTEEATPTPSPTATVPACAGDCAGDGTVAVAEVLRGIRIALAELEVRDCEALDFQMDEQVTVDELVAAVNGAAVECPAPPPASFAEIQETIFTPKCATLFCHDSAGRNGNLVLEPATAYAQLVGAAPTLLAARNAGLLRVAAGDASRSFLLTKLSSPPPVFGSPMPLGALPLADAEIDLIRRWVVEGALR